MSKRLLLIAAAGLLIRLPVSTVGPFDALTADSLTYMKLARNIEAGKGFTLDGATPDASRAPVYPYFIAAVSDYQRLVPIQVWQSIIDAGSSAWVYAAAQAAAGPAVALASAALYAFHPVFIGYTRHILAESVFFHLWLAALALMALAVFEKRAARKDLWAAGAGLALGLAVLCRPAHIFYPVLVVGVFYFAARDRRRWLRMSALFAAFFAIAILPWTLRNWRAFHRVIPVMTGGGPAWYIGSLTHFPTAAEVNALAEAHGHGPKDPGMDAVYNREAVKNWKANWPALTAQLPWRLARFWTTSHSAVYRIEEPNSVYIDQGRWLTFGFKLLLFALQGAIVLGGLYGAWRLRKRWRETLVFLLPPAYLSLHIFNDWYPNRYHLSALPCLMILLFWGRAR